MTGTDPSTTEPEGNRPSSQKPGDHPLYPLVLKMVLWGENRDDIFNRLALNGISDKAAWLLYEEALADRVQTIRCGCTHDILVGIALILASIVVFLACWLGLGFIPKILIFGCAAAFGIGSWKFITGLARYLMAPYKTGSVADDS